MIIGFLFLIVLGFTIASGIKMQESYATSEREIVQDFTSGIAQEFELASQVHDGYIRRIELPYQIDSRFDYDISYANATLIVIVNEREYNALIPKISGNISQGWVVIRKVNGSVQVSDE